MLSGYDDSIGQIIFGLLIPSGRVYINRDVIRNSSTTLSQIAKKMAKTVAAQQKSLESRDNQTICWPNKVETALMPTLFAVLI